MARVITNAPSTITATFYGDDNTVDLDSPPAVVVTNLAGTVINTGTGALTGSNTGNYKYTLPPQTASDTLTITWSGTAGSQSYVVTTVVEVVSARYFQLPELRAYDSRLADTTKYPNSLLAPVRDFVESRFEDITGRSFVTRYAVDTFAGTGSDTAYVSEPYWQSVRSVLQDGTDVTDTVVPKHSDAGAFAMALDCPGVWDSRSVYQIGYTFGETTVPAMINEAAKRYARYLIMSRKTSTDERATQLQLGTDEGRATGSVIALGMASGDSTGIPEVDAVLHSPGIQIPGGIW